MGVPSASSRRHEGSAALDARLRHRSVHRGRQERETRVRLAQQTAQRPPPRSVGRPSVDGERLKVWAPQGGARAGRLSLHRTDDRDDVRRAAREQLDRRQRAQPGAQHDNPTAARRRRRSRRGGEGGGATARRSGDGAVVHAAAMLGQLDDGRFGEWHPRRQRLQLREDRVERRAAGVERELHQRRRLLAEARGGLAAGGLVRPDGHLEQVEAAARRLRGGSG